VLGEHRAVRDNVVDSRLAVLEVHLSARGHGQRVWFELQSVLVDMRGAVRNLATFDDRRGLGCLRGGGGVVAVAVSVVVIVVAAAGRAEDYQYGKGRGDAQPEPVLLSHRLSSSRSGG